MLVPPPVASVPGADATVALFAYTGAGRTVIARLKFARHRDALVPLARQLAMAIAVAAGVPARASPDDATPAAESVLVTWVPTTAARRRHRGYDQAELVARAVARSLGVSCRRVLRRESGAQSGRGRAERWAAAFAVPARASGRVAGTVVVVDDVRTTGASLAAAAAAVRAAGADRVVVATLAATPEKSGPTSVPHSPGHPLQSA